jgi:hypothetical protein
MITKEEFKNYIESYQIFSNGLERFSEALSGSKHGVSIFECDWAEAVGKMLDCFLDSHFTETGVDTITWWMFEDVDHIIVQTVTDLFNDKSEIKYNVNNIEDLWNYMIKFKEDNFKNVK